MRAQSSARTDDRGPDCFTCVHFAVTHERALPYACRAFAMKTRHLPSLEVLRTSGHPCRGHLAKPSHGSKARESS